MVYMISWSASMIVEFLEHFGAWMKEAEEAAE